MLRATGKTKHGLNLGELRKVRTWENWKGLNLGEELGDQSRVGRIESG